MKPSVRSSQSSPSPEVGTTAGWTFLTNHTHVLLCLFRNPDERLRDVAVAVGITERMVAEAGYLQISKEGRRNHYRVNSRLRLRHPLESRHTIGELLTTLSPSD